jgi:TPR repeat protein
MNTKSKFFICLSVSMFLGGATVHAQEKTQQVNDDIKAKLDAISAQAKEGSFSDAKSTIDFLVAQADEGNTRAMHLLGDLNRDGKIVGKDIAKALGYYLQAEAKGDVAAYAKIGSLYLTFGTELGKTSVDAQKTYEEGAAKGDTWSMLSLGDMYRNGSNGTKDASKALEFYTMAELKGNKMASAKIGDVYYRDRFENKREKALPYYEKSAAKDDGSALLALGDIYNEGAIVPVDLKRSLEYYERAKALGIPAAYGKIGDLYSRNALSLGVNQSDAMNLYEEGAEKGDPWSFIGLGDAYRQGEMVTQDLKKAADAYQTAAAAGNAVANTRLGDLYYRKWSELGVERKEALKFYQAGVDKGEPWSMMGLGEIYAQGDLVKKDLAKALEYYESARQKGTAVAATKIGDLYYRQSQSIGVNPADALAYYQEGFDKGDVWATIGLGDVYRDGLITTQDLGKALSLYEQALAKGNVPAHSRLGELLLRYPVELGQNSAKAIPILQAGAALNDPWSYFFLAEAYKDGTATDKNVAAAKVNYQKAYDAGAKPAYAALCDLLLLGTRSEQSQGLKLAKQGIKAKLPGLYPVLANASFYGRGLPYDPKAGIRLLEQASKAGDVPATMRLVQVYSSGLGKVIQRNPKKAKSLLEKVSTQISEPRLESERLFLFGASASSPTQYNEFSQKLDGLSPAARIAAARRVSSSNPNAFVYSLQRLLRDRGAYNGDLNGMLTSKTLSAFRRECLNVASKPVCDKGPLSPEMRSVLAGFFTTD